MSLADYRAATARKSPGKGKASSSTPKPATTKELEAQAEVATVGRYVGHYGTQPARRYVLQTKEQADALDAAFYTIVGATPPQS